MTGDCLEAGRLRALAWTEARLLPSAASGPDAPEKLILENDTGRKENLLDERGPAGSLFLRL
jgi:hypothetical protein